MVIPCFVTTLKVAVSGDPAVEKRAIAEHLAAVVERLQPPVAAIVRPCEVPLDSELWFAEAVDAVALGHDDDPSARFLVDLFYRHPAGRDELADIARERWLAELTEAGLAEEIAVIDETLSEGCPSEVWVAFFEHRLDWDVRTPDPLGLIPVIT